MQEISENLCEAIGESPSVGAKLSQLQEAGYSLNLLLDCRQTDSEEDLASLERSLLTADDGAAGDPKPPQVDFQINARDLAFLRSVGIDPTRPARSRRSLDQPTTDAAVDANAAEE